MWITPKSDYIKKSKVKGSFILLSSYAIIIILFNYGFKWTLRDLPKLV